MSNCMAAQVGTIQAGYVAESGATLLEFATPDETVAAVRNGEADAVFADKDYLAPIVAESGGDLSFAGEDIQLGGGVGMGYSQHSGVVIVCDGSAEADEKLARVLFNDPATGVMRHADAGYDVAKASARANGLNLPMGGA